jgi:hypothetical protein
MPLSAAVGSSMTIPVYTGYRPLSTSHSLVSLLDLFVRMMLAAERTELFHLETLSRRLLILHAGVVLPLALGALKCNLFARHIDYLNFLKPINKEA